MKTHAWEWLFRTVLLGCALLFATLACGPTSSLLSGTGEQADIEIAVAATLDFERAVADAAEATLDRKPTDTAVPTSTTPETNETPAPEPKAANPEIRASTNTNCRTGPHPVYNVIGYLTTGQTSTVVGKLDGGGWWYIENTTAGRENCWVWGETTTVTGSTADLPVITPPPTPTHRPLPQWAGNWSTFTGSQTYNIYIVQDDGQISFPILDYSAYGNLSDANRRVSGTLISSSPATSNPTSSSQISFEWRLLENGDQFRGKLSDGGNSEAWCGARNGMSFPDPCLGP